MRVPITHDHSVTHRRGNPNCGQAVVVLLAVVVLIAVVAAGVAALGVRILRQQQAQAAADAAALAGVESGQSAAEEMAARNGAVLTSFRSSADGMTVTVAVMLEGESASARATRAP